MALVLELSLQKKPLVGSLLNEMNYYSAKAVVEALNACRLHGHAQILATNDQEGRDVMDEHVARAHREILAMALEREKFDFEVKIIQDDANGQARRIDIRLQTKKR